jgi:hypothetical protein
MSLSRRLCAIRSAAIVLFAPGIAAAAPVLNKEGYWGIEVDRGACIASMTLQGGSIFLLHALEGTVSFALMGQTPLARGKTVRLETEAYSFDFKASYSKDGGGLFYEDALDARALAALRLARQVRILADGKQLAAMTFEGTGFGGTLDGVTACSQGEKGWWGPGVGDGADSRTEALVYDKQEIWGIAAGKDPGVCVAQADLGDKLWLQILAADGQLGLAVASNGARLPRGRKATIKTDAYTFDFKPKFRDDGHYMSAPQAFDSQELAALSQAKWLGVTVDGKELVDAAVGETSFADLLTSVAACSRGEKGWWGAGAPVAR